MSICHVSEIAGYSDKFGIILINMKEFGIILINMKRMV